MRDVGSHLAGRHLRAVALATIVLVVSPGAYRCGAPVEEIRLEATIRFDGADGRRLMKLVPRRGQVKLEDAAGDLVARFKLVEGHLRVEGNDRAQLGVVVPADPDGMELHLLEGDHGKLLYRLTREPDGDLRLEDGARLLYESKKREYGYKTVDGEGRVRSRVRVKQNKISLREADGQTTLSTKDAIPPAAVACFTWLGLSVEHQTALALGLVHWARSGL